MKTFFNAAGSILDIAPAVDYAVAARSWKANRVTNEAWRMVADSVRNAVDSVTVRDAGGVISKADVERLSKPASQLIQPRSADSTIPRTITIDLGHITKSRIRNRFLELERIKRAR